MAIISTTDRPVRRRSDTAGHESWRTAGNLDVGARWGDKHPVQLFGHGNISPASSLGRAVGLHGPEGMLDPAGFFSHGEREPFQYGRVGKIAGPEGFRKYSAGADLASTIGYNNLSERLSRHASHYRQDEPYVSPFVNADGSVNWEALGPGGASHDAMAAIIHNHRARLNAAGRAGQDFNYDERMNKFRLSLGQDIEGAMKQGLIAEIDPTLKRAQDEATANLDTAAVGAQAEAAIRSRFAAAVQKDSAERLARISANLGLGNTTNSPAAAALAQQEAQSASSQMASGLRDMSIQTSYLNKQQHAADIDLATKIASARHAILNGDSKSIIGMQGDVTALVDALYSRKTSLDLQRQALEQSGKGGSPAAGAIGGAISGASAGSVAGPYGALAGGVIGGVGGYLGSR